MKRYWLLAFSFCLFAFPSMADTVELKNGDKLDVKIVEETDKNLVVEHPQLGKIIIPKDELKPPTPPNPGLFGTEFLLGWNRNVSAGVSGSDGNSRGFSLNASMGLSRSAETYRGNFSSAFFFSTQDSETISNEFFANYQHDFLLGHSDFYIFLQGRYQYDDFQAWKNRISSSTGMGYQIFKRDKLSLDGELGFGFSRSWGDENQWRPEGVVGLVFSWKPLEGHELTADVTYYPNFSDLPEFRLLANAAYIVGITQLDGLSLMFGAKNEYDSDQPGDNNNLKYYGNLVYDF
ncbi:MAG: DUF481 domain-containing protein [Myxococcota bacterium]|nr:DUF481 domain-containing protein [Myxococcota bacterium]